MVSREMERECVVVFDEAHNIDNVCIEALSGVCGGVWCPSVGVVVTGGAGRAGGEPCVVLAPKLCISPHITAASIPTQEALRAPRPSAVNLRQQTLDSAGRNIATLRREIERVKETDAGRLKAEYQRLLSGLQAQGALEEEDTQVGPGRRLGHGVLCGPWCAVRSLVRCAASGALPLRMHSLAGGAGARLAASCGPHAGQLACCLGRNLWQACVGRCMHGWRPRSGQGVDRAGQGKVCCTTNQHTIACRAEPWAYLYPPGPFCTHAALAGQPRASRGCAARGCARQHPPCRSGAGPLWAGQAGYQRGASNACLNGQKGIARGSGSRCSRQAREPVLLHGTGLLSRPAPHPWAARWRSLWHARCCQRSRCCTPRMASHAPCCLHPTRHHLRPGPPSPPPQSTSWPSCSASWPSCGSGWQSPRCRTTRRPRSCKRCRR